MSRSPASWELHQHPLVLKIAEGVLGRQVGRHGFDGFRGWLSEPYWLQFPVNLDVSQLTAIGPGNKAQAMHTGGNGFLFNFRKQGLDAKLHSIWAVDDFTAENGASQIVKGSHLWPEGREPTAADPVVQA